MYCFIPTTASAMNQSTLVDMEYLVLNFSLLKTQVVIRHILSNLVESELVLLQIKYFLIQFIQMVISSLLVIGSDSLAANVFGLGEGGDFHHKCWCGEPNFD